MSRSQEQLDKKALMEQASNTTFKRKSIHQAIVDRPDGRKQAANSNHAPFSVIAKGGKGAKQYQDQVLCFLDPCVWDVNAPTLAGQDGFMRARPKITAERCLTSSGKWRPLICFAKNKGRYSYLGTYEIATDVDGSQMIG